MLGLFTAGLITGGTLSALVLWLVSGLASPVPEVGRYSAIVFVAALAVLRDLGFVRVWVPQNARQIPQDVLQRNVVRGSLQFGFELGTGVRTYVSASTPYVLAIALLLSSPSLLVAVAAGVGFGLGRAATPLIRYASGAGDEWDERLRTRLRFITVTGAMTATTTFGFLLAHNLSG